MSYRIKKSENVATAVRRIACEEVDKALGEIADTSLDRHETVHQVRKRCKKLRGLIRIVRPSFEKAYQRENAWYRDAAQLLSYVRDAQSIIDTHDELIEHYGLSLDAGAFDSIRRQLVARRGRIAEDEAGIDERLREFGQRLRAGRSRITRWKLKDKGFAAVRGGLAKTYDRARQAMTTALSEPTSDNFHQWRKCVKYHGYHARLLQSTWESALRAHRSAADELGELLGDEHNLAVLRETITQQPDEFADATTVDTYLAIIDRRRGELRTSAAELGPLLLAEKTKHFCRRMECYWRQWRNPGATKRSLVETYVAVPAP